VDPDPDQGGSVIGLLDPDPYFCNDGFGSGILIFDQRFEEFLGKVQHFIILLIYYQFDNIFLSMTTKCPGRIRPDP
jgi:hypothetical protein